MLIELRSVSYLYNRGRSDEVAALKDVRLLVRSGEVLAVLGREGSGKSTLVQQMNGLLAPTSGQVLVDGEALTPQRAAALRAGVAMVFQYPERQLFAPTVFDDIAFALRRQKRSISEIEEWVREAATLVGLDLDSLGSRRPIELSGSERRRVAIAGALVARPILLLLDEPLSGLDPSSRRELTTILKRLRSQSGMGIVLVSHSLEEALPLADRLIVMDGGSVVFEGEGHELLEQREGLARWRLKLPATVQFVDMLRERGLEVPPDIWQVPDVVAAVAKARGRRRSLHLSEVQ